jgi:hypothetical protein
MGSKYLNFQLLIISQDTFNGYGTKFTRENFFDNHNDNESMYWAQHKGQSLGLISQAYGYVLKTFFLRSLHLASLLHLQEPEEGERSHRPLCGLLRT